MDQIAAVIGILCSLLLLHQGLEWAFRAGIEHNKLKLRVSEEMVKLKGLKRTAAIDVVCGLVLLWVSALVLIG